MSDTVMVIALIRAKPGREQQVKEALLGLCAPTRAEKGCINYDLHQSREDSTQFAFHENWVSQEDLDAHRQSPHMQAYRKRTAEWLAEPTQVTLWARIG